MLILIYLLIHGVFERRVGFKFLDHVSPNGHSSKVMDIIFESLREAAKKVNFLVVRPVRGGGGGVKGRTTKEKEHFLKL